MILSVVILFFLIAILVYYTYDIYTDLDRTTKYATSSVENLNDETTALLKDIKTIYLALKQVDRENINLSKANTRLEYILDNVRSRLTLLENPLKTKKKPSKKKSDDHATHVRLHKKATKVKK